ncbi:MAG: pilus assembly protein TadG-related protein [Gaiellales bacterium]
MFHRRLAEERGTTMVIVTFSIVALFGLAGLVIDGGRAYSDRREVQNAADSAALAGAKTLSNIMHNPSADESQILAAVTSSITTNGTNGGFDCNLVNASGTTIGSCPTSDIASLPSGTAGVTVTARDEQATTFMRVLGKDSFDASAPATAQVQALRGGTAPFMICGLDAAQGGQDPPLLLPSGSTWVLNTAAVYPANTTEYRIHDQNGPGSCGGGSNGFKGLANSSLTYTLPGWVDNDTGTQAGPVRQMIASPDACQDDISTGCQMVIPICTSSNGGTGTNLQLWCVAMGTFRITYSSNTEHRGVYIGAAIVSSGQGGGVPMAGEARIIKLSE